MNYDWNKISERILRKERRAAAIFLSGACVCASLIFVALYWPGMTNLSLTMSMPTKILIETTCASGILGGFFLGMFGVFTLITYNEDVVTPILPGRERELARRIIEAGEAGESVAEEVNSLLTKQGQIFIYQSEILLTDLVSLTARAELEKAARATATSA